MELINKLNNDIKKFMKEKNSKALNAIKILKTEIKKAEVEKQRELNEEEILTIIRKQIKMRRDSIEQYSNAGRKDLVEEEKYELEILQQYLPPEMSDEEIENIVKNIINEIGENAKFGQIMGLAMKKLKGKVDGNRVNSIVKKLLS
ncbi:aspartyl-tRNA amidotransferase subunit B [Marinitoga sp. 1197]|uniref:GatB/YqeY domain-containing protein n=1 Tax=Marinitoga sp. 1197 TaxID=1428449 RepID=UPI000641826C|nr:GatB/YqeY domain-containing protein [Marinitoga sp. 1197]KLO21061.1 aspartyl-tRNA amidotransferase subunit B [Marinitoga sp. 1197]